MNRPPDEPVTAPEPRTLPSEHDRTRRSLLGRLLAPLFVVITEEGVLSGPVKEAAPRYADWHRQLQAISGFAPVVIGHGGRSHAAKEEREDTSLTSHDTIGVVTVHGREFVLADIPGLIEGAAEGAGVGDRFLGHIERCRVLIHLVDASGDDPVDAYEIVRAELEAYGADLAKKKEIVALSKCDALDDDAIEAKVAELRAAARKKPLVLSAVAGRGVKEALAALAREIDKSRTTERAEATEDEGEEQESWHP